MSQLTSSLSAEAEAVKSVYAALNRNDLPSIIKVFDPQIEWIDPVEYPEDGTSHGHAEVEAHFSKSRAQWAEGSCEPERFILVGDKVIAFVNVRVRLKNEVEWREGQLADVYTFRDGKVVQARSFPDRRQALAWAGADSSATD